MSASRRWASSFVPSFSLSIISPKKLFLRFSGVCQQFLVTDLVWVYFIVYALMAEILLLKLLKLFWRRTKKKYTFWKLTANLRLNKIIDAKRIGETNFTKKSSRNYDRHNYQWINYHVTNCQAKNSVFNFFLTTNKIFLVKKFGAEILK